MSGAIRVLSEEAVAKIAAGEVVERPAAALKELLENSVDAGARRIEAAIEGGGVTRIEVADDGGGIAPDELLLALTRHATSKIARAEDLGTVVTYGFRGEALPAIAAAAARLTVRSRAATADGAEVVVEAGVIGPVVPAAQAPGTRVEVLDLFGRLPARRAFLRAAQTEAAACHDVVLRCALAAPQVAVRLRTERGEAFASAGTGDRADVLARAYGPAIRADLVAVDYATPTVRVTGYVATPERARATRVGQTLLVRGRPVTSRAIAYAAESAYAGRLPRGRFPVFVLAVDVDPAAVDVNVHPQKREVRFADERLVAGSVHNAVVRALEAGLRPPGPPPAPTGEWVPARLAPALPSARQTVVPWPEPSRPAAVPAAPVAVPAPVPARAGGVSPGFADPVTTASPGGAGDAPDALLGGLVALRQVRLTYILAEGPDGLYVVDQHAAHERVRYEEIGRADATGRAPARQRLLPPLVLDLPPALVEVAAARGADLTAAGFDADPFGPASVRVREVPAGMRLPGQVLRDLLEALGDPTDNAPAAHRRRALLACRTAVRAGDALGLAEMGAILATLAVCQAPATCPHGRPTVRRLAWDEVGGWFRRRA